MGDHGVLPRVRYKLVTLPAWSEAGCERFMELGQFIVQLIDILRQAIQYWSAPRWKVLRSSDPSRHRTGSFARAKEPHFPDYSQRSVVVI